MGRLRLSDVVMIICGKDCEGCDFATIDDSDKTKVKVYCAIKSKWYYYGQCIPCGYRNSDFKEVLYDQT